MKVVEMVRIAGGRPRMRGYSVFTEAISPGNCPGT
jgi:hypothetical protein